ncbi:Rad17 cell cycle checkpoint protein-domain-containing protein [Collybia nuda]|uniref:Rad17 cell cycle checkpoint protein-domain-containing protein n=1 Tax=Collybia nuda TaxID=64659 RepID=A0A9P5Y754_9AGAR|nr:Rad17 cell cycle checkpoint protein-domain-containing protein [Collybia nuda]
MAPKSQPRGSQSKTTSSQPKAKRVKLEVASSNSKRFDPLTAFRTASQKTEELPGPSQRNVKGKGKEKARIQSVEFVEEPPDDRLWVDIYEPTTEAELAVHSRKVEDVRRWLDEAFGGGPSGKLTKYRRILALTGPAGTAKTTTVRVLSREMGFEVMEWRNAMSENTSNIFSDALPELDDIPSSKGYGYNGEASFTKFENFINRTLNCHNIFSSGSSIANLPRSQSQTKAPPPTSTPTPDRRVILLEDLPNILHSDTQIKFHATLQSLVQSLPSSPPVPVIIILSDAGVRGEASDERLSNGEGWGKDRNGVLDIRTVLSRELLNGPYVTVISFNPIAPTLLTKALQALLIRQFASSNHSIPSRDVLDIIVESSNGDIRSAVMALQFACIVDIGSKGKKKRIGSKGSVVVLESVTRREQSLFLFHLLGKVLYNKRKGDLPSPSASAKDIQREKTVDAQLKDPPKLPSHLKEHERRPSRINADVLYADSPIDSSLFSLYIHQNYTQFCDTVEQCDGVADWLSWVDSSGGEAWYQANPHRFHLLTLGTLHSLPTPVTRRSQKIFKPAFFECLQKEKNAWDAVRDARGWVLGEGIIQGTNRESSWAAGGWSRTDVAIELGGILKAKDAVGKFAPQPPTSHRLFSNLSFAFGKPFGDIQQLSEGDLEQDNEQEVNAREVGSLIRETEGGGWLESDDIEEF